MCAYVCVWQGVCLCVDVCYLRSYCSLFPQVFKGKKPRRKQTRGNKLKSQHAESIVLDIKCDLYDHWYLAPQEEGSRGKSLWCHKEKKLKDGNANGDDIKNRLK